MCEREDGGGRGGSRRGSEGNGREIFGEVVEGAFGIVGFGFEGVVVIVVGDGFGGGGERNGREGFGEVVERTSGIVGHGFEGIVVEE